MRLLQHGELARDHQLFQLWESILKPLKIIAECAQSSRGPLFVLLLECAPEVILDKSASDSIEVHVAALSETLVRIPDSIN